MSDLPFARTPDGLTRISLDTLLFVDDLFHRELDTHADIHYRLSLIEAENPHFVEFLYKKVEGLPLSKKIFLLEGALFTYESFKRQHKSNTFVEEFFEMYEY